MKPIHLADILD